MLAENEKEEIKSKEEEKNRLWQLHSARLLSLSHTLSFCRRSLALGYCCMRRCLVTYAQQQQKNLFRFISCCLLRRRCAWTATESVIGTLPTDVSVVVFWRRLQKTSWCRILLCVCVCVCAAQWGQQPAQCAVTSLRLLLWCWWWMKTLRWQLPRIHTHTLTCIHTQLQLYVYNLRAKF